MIVLCSLYNWSAQLKHSGQRQTQTKWATRAKQSQLCAPSCGGNRGSRTHRKAGVLKPPALIYPCSAFIWDTEYLGSTASFSCFRDGTQNRISCAISQKQTDKGEWLRSLFSLTWNVLLVWKSFSNEPLVHYCLQSGNMEWGENGNLFRK